MSTSERLPLVHECDECGEPSALHLMRHYWDRSVCLLCERKPQTVAEQYSDLEAFRGYKS